MLKEVTSILVLIFLDAFFVIAMVCMANVRLNV
jgi:hypothetical protein